MGPTPVQRWLVLGAGLILLFLPAAAQARIQGIRPEVERAAGKCNLCHSQLLVVWQTLAHGAVACTACHPAGVLKGSPLKPQDSVRVCGKCHRKEAEAPRSGVTCLSCHSLHRQVDAPLLQRQADGLCLGCHAKDGEFSHRNAATGERGRVNCTSCHDPHGAAEGGLFAAKPGGEAWQLKKKHTHQPVAEGKCKACHDVHRAPVAPGQSGVVAEEEDDEEAELSKLTPGVGGPNRSLLSRPPTTICYECHGDKQEMFLKSKHAVVGSRVQPPQDNACAACHLPHGSDYAHLTTYEGSRLCLTCHPDKTPHHFLVSAAVRQGQLQCVQCHNPHGTEYDVFLVLDRQQICGKCHKK